MGLGTIGSAVMKLLLEKDHEVFGYDQRKFINLGRRTKPTIHQLIQDTDIILGCTGHDITKQLNDIFSGINKNKTLISGSSEDKEFLTLLKFLAKLVPENIINPMTDIEYPLPNGKRIIISRGGFPINFDDSGESVPSSKIQLTRGLLFGAVIQAAHLLTRIHQTNIMPCKIFKLDPFLQRFVVNEWVKCGNNMPQDKLEKFQDIDWILKHSEGELYEPSPFKESFL